MHKLKRDRSFSTIYVKSIFDHKVVEFIALSKQILQTKLTRRQRVKRNAQYKRYIPHPVPNRSDPVPNGTYRTGAELTESFIGPGSGSWDGLGDAVLVPVPVKPVRWFRFRSIATLSFGMLGQKEDLKSVDTSKFFDAPFSQDAKLRAAFSQLLGPMVLFFFGLVVGAYTSIFLLPGKDR